MQNKNQLSHLKEVRMNFINLFKKDFIYLFLERVERREKVRERNFDMQDTSIGCLLHAPSWGPGPQPRHVPWLGMELVTFQFTGRHSIHWTTPARTNLINLLKVFFLSFFIFLILTRGHAYWFWREGREGERERNIDGEASMDWWPCTCTLTGTGPATLWFMGWPSNQLSHTGQGKKLSF